MCLIHLPFIDKQSQASNSFFRMCNKMWNEIMMLFDEPIFHFDWRAYRLMMFSFLLAHFMWNLGLFHFDEKRWHINEQCDTEMHTYVHGGSANERENSLETAACRVLNCDYGHCNLIYTHYTLVSNIINIIQYTWQYQYSKIKFYSVSVRFKSLSSKLAA